MSCRSTQLFCVSITALFARVGLNELRWLVQHQGRVELIDNSGRPVRILVPWRHDPPTEHRNISENEMLLDVPHEAGAYAKELVGGGEAKLRPDVDRHEVRAEPTGSLLPTRALVAENISPRLSAVTTHLRLSLTGELEALIFSLISFDRPY